MTAIVAGFGNREDFYSAEDIVIFGGQGKTARRLAFATGEPGESVGYWVKEAANISYRMPL